MYTTANGAPCEAEPASPVKLYYVPEWLQLRLLKAFGPTNFDAKDGCSLFWFWAGTYCNSPVWLDHWGTTDLNGRDVLVAEPYMSIVDDFSDAGDFAAMLDCVLIVGEKSYWFPGKTIRLLFMPKLEKE